MIISLVAVGKHHRNKINDALELFKSFNVCLLSDLERNDVFYFEKYEKKKFSYFDKLYFSLEMVNKFNEDVFYIDITKINEVNLNFPKDVPFYYKSHWPHGDTFADYIKYNYFKPLLDKWNNVDYLNLPAIRETELFFNKDLDVEPIIEKLKEIQPIFREMSLNNPTYPGYDNAEGIALSYALKSLNII